MLLIRVVVTCVLHRGSNSLSWAMDVRIMRHGIISSCQSYSRRLPTDPVDNFETDQTDSIAFDYTNFDKY